MIPLLLHGTAVPHPDELPGSLKELAYRNAVDIRHNHFQRDLDKLVEHLQKMPAESKSLDPIPADSDTSSENCEPSFVQPPVLQRRKRRHATPPAPMPPKREPRRDSAYGKSFPINLRSLAIVVAAVVAIGLVAFVVYSVFPGGSHGTQMIP